MFSFGSKAVKPERKKKAKAGGGFLSGIFGKSKQYSEDVHMESDDEEEKYEQKSAFDGFSSNSLPVQANSMAQPQVLSMPQQAP